MDGLDPRFQQLVDNVDIFHGLRAPDVAKIFARGMTQYIEKGDAVFHKGTIGNKMYVILGGTVGVFDGPKQLSTLGVGDTFGEMSLLMGEPRTASVVAIERCNLFVLDDNVFQNLLTKRVAVQMLLNIARLMGKRIKDANLAMRESEGR